MDTEFTGLSRQLNVAVLHIAGQLHPNGFDVSGYAPNNYADLCAYVETHGRYSVWGGASDNTIYGDSEVNYAFRAWHDYHHVTKGLGFSPEEERLVTQHQVNDILSIYGDNEQSREMIKLIEADGNGQTEYYEHYGEFPVDQKAFVIDYLETGAIHDKY